MWVTLLFYDQLSLPCRSTDTTLEYGRACTRQPPTGTEARAIEPQNGEVEIPWAVGSLDGTRRPTAASQSEGYLPNIVFTCLGMAAGVFPEAWKSLV